MCFELNEFWNRITKRLCWGAGALFRCTGSSAICVATDTTTRNNILPRLHVKLFSSGQTSKINSTKIKRGILISYTNYAQRITCVVYNCYILLNTRDKSRDTFRRYAYEQYKFCQQKKKKCRGCRIIGYFIWDLFSLISRISMILKFRKRGIPHAII
jgi:hypothetical protein